MGLAAHVVRCHVLVILTWRVAIMSREVRARRKPPSLRMRERQKIWKMVPKLRKIKPARPRG